MCINVSKFPSLSIEIITGVLYAFRLYDERKLSIHSIAFHSVSIPFNVFREFLWF